MTEINWKTDIVAPTLSQVEGYADAYLEILLNRLQALGTDGAAVIAAAHDDFTAWCTDEASKLRAIQKARAEAQAMLDHAEALEAEGQNEGGAA